MDQGIFDDANTQSVIPQACLDTVPHSIAIVDANRRYVFGNRFFCQSYKIAPTEIVGLSSKLIFCSEPEWESLGALAYSVIRAGRTFEQDHVLRRMDGRRYAARLTGRLVDAGNPSLGTLWVVTDLSEKNLGLASLDSLSIGVVELAARARVMATNATAEAILSVGRGITVRNGVLRATDQTAELALRRALERMSLCVRGTPAAKGDLLFLPRPDGRPLSLLVCPAWPESLGADPQPAATIFLCDPEDQPPVSPTALVDLWDLTPAESRLRPALIGGESLDQYAKTVGISLATARTQLKHVFSKSGCVRQAELIAEASTHLLLRMGRLAGGGGR